MPPLKDLGKCTCVYIILIMTYPKLDDHLKVVIKLVILCQSSVRQCLCHFVTVYLLLLPANKQSLEERQQTLNHYSTNLITCNSHKVVANLSSETRFRLTTFTYSHWSSGEKGSM